MTIRKKLTSGGWLFIIFCSAVLLRLYNLSWPNFYTVIESLHIPSTITYTESGHFAPDSDYSAPFRKLLQYPLIKAFGDIPIARRLLGAIFGSLTVLLVMLIGKKLWPKKILAYGLVCF